jgi:type IV secretion system protein VirB1
VSEVQSRLGRGDSVDIGLMQVNSGNLSALGMTARSALDPCVSMAGGAAVLRAAYGGGSTSADQQVAMLIALSRYNTGSPLRGIVNGYARTVMARAGSEIPPPVVGSQKPSRALDALAEPDAPPAWNVGAVAAYAQSHGAPWLVSLAPVSSNKQASQGPSSEPVAPMALASNGSLVATNPATALAQPKPRSP